MGVSYVSGKPFGTLHTGWLKYPLNFTIFRSNRNKRGQLPSVLPAGQQLLEAC